MSDSSGSSSSAPSATIEQKSDQQPSHPGKRGRAKSRGSSTDMGPVHAFTEAYVNTHIRRHGYTLPTPPPTPSTSSSPTSQPSPTSGAADDDEGLDDEQGASWEEWSCEQKNEWLEKEVRALIPIIRSHYVIPASDRVNSQGDPYVFEGYAGLALMFFHSYYKILNALPEHADEPSDMRAEQQRHAQRQYAISLLQAAHDYALYTLALIAKQEEEADSDDCCLSDAERQAVDAARQRCSFLRSKAGPLALSACIWHHRARYLLLHPVTTPNVASPAFDPATCLTERRRCLEQLMALRGVAKKAEDDEFFNGRAGYLYALNFVHSHLQAEVERMRKGQQQGTTKRGPGGEGDGGKDVGGERSLVDNRDDTKEQPTAEEEERLMDTKGLSAQLAEVEMEIEAVHGQLIAHGTQGHHKAKVLSYRWHDKDYYGAAHGTCGILQQLLQSPPSILSSTLPLILATADHLLSLRLPSGNFPSSADSRSDRLVQWCHGAPGFALLFARLHAVTGDAKWLQAAVEAGEVVWQRGLLKKGPGLCHGIAGNGYVFLALYVLTKDEAHLHRAYHFAHFTLTEHRQRLFDQPDRPYSLYNGQAGFVCFAVDAEQVRKVPSSFPGYQLMNPREHFTAADAAQHDARPS